MPRAIAQIPAFGSKPLSPFKEPQSPGRLSVGPAFLRSSPSKKPMPMAKQVFSPHKQLQTTRAGTPMDSPERAKQLAEFSDKKNSPANLGAIAEDSAGPSPLSTTRPRP
jgi:hypothetical protein